jgi:hypothetical protein
MEKPGRADVRFLKSDLAALDIQIAMGGNARCMISLRCVYQPDTASFMILTIMSPLPAPLLSVARVVIATAS